MKIHRKILVIYANMANEAISKLMKNIENNIILKKLYQLVKFITSDRSLFLLSNDNIIRKTAKALIEWGYPFFIIKNSFTLLHRNYIFP